MEDHAMKKDYTTPTIQIVALQQQGQLLMNSGLSKRMGGTNPEGFDIDPDDLDDDDVLR